MASQLLDPDSKPPLRAYPNWLRARSGIKLSGKTESFYNSLVLTAQKRFEESSYWRHVLDSAQYWNDFYVSKNGDGLFESFSPVVVTKPYDSFIEKTYRRNVVDNTNWPLPPYGGWLNPNSCHEVIKDLVRTTIDVRYLDGVKFIASNLIEVGQSDGLHVDQDFQSSVDGYYAIHLIVHYPVLITQVDWSVQERVVNVEIQITTTFKHVLKKLLHRVYARDRSKPKPVSDNVRWDLGSDEFLTGNLGHILHHLEGMIVVLRDKKDGGDS